MLVRILATLMVALALSSSTMIEEDVEDTYADPSKPIVIKHLTAATYVLHNRELARHIKGKPHYYHRYVWHGVRELTDIFGITDRIGAFSVMLEESTRAAYVLRYEDADVSGRGEQWLLTVNAEFDQDIAIAYPTNLHEMMHVLAYAVNIHKTSGCLKEDASNERHRIYTLSFAYTFWRHCERSKERQEYVASHFVTRYASTDVNEDVAESAKVFLVCGDSHSHLGIARQKIEFFARIPQMQEIRTRLTKGITAAFFASVRSANPHVCDPDHHDRKSD